MGQVPLEPSSHWKISFLQDSHGRQTTGKSDGRCLPRDMVVDGHGEFHALRPCKGRCSTAPITRSSSNRVIPGLDDGARQRVPDNT